MANLAFYSPLLPLTDCQVHMVHTGKAMSNSKTFQGLLKSILQFSRTTTKLDIKIQEMAP